MSKPLKLLIIVALNLLVLCVLSWQLIKMSGPIPDPGASVEQPPVPQAAAKPAEPRWHEMVGHDLPGAIRWQGVWFVKPQQPAGALYAIAFPDPEEPDRWKATFAGYWGEFLKYQVQTPGSVGEDRAITFEGSANLGNAREQYQWKGRMTADLFEGQYVNESNKQAGGFSLTPVANATAPGSPVSPTVP